MTVPDLAAPIRTALIGASGVTDELSAYKGSFPVFTKIPVPDDAPVKIVLVSSGLTIGENDGLTDERPVVGRDVMFYGRRSTDPNQDEYRAVERMAFASHALFHRQRLSITVSGWSVVDITASGPAPAPVDDEQTVGRMISLTISLAKQN